MINEDYSVVEKDKMNIFRAKGKFDMLTNLRYIYLNLF